MNYTTLITCDSLAQNLSSPDWVIVDCRFNLAATEEGRQMYLQTHVPSAVYAHLDDDLSGPPVTDNGRHPLPSQEALTALFGRLGIDARKQVVVYDDANGAIASRLWWMLRYAGHDGVAVLDGGWSAWQAGNYPTQVGNETNSAVTFTPEWRAEWLVQIDAVPPLPLLVDSRAPERYRGEIEPLDARPGHIPGAVNYFFQWNWDANGRYLPPEQIRSGFESLLGETPAEETTFYCGSGVTACANLLALAYAGMGNGRLYVGSWSEWSRDPSRPVALGD